MIKIAKTDLRKSTSGKVVNDPTQDVDSSEDTEDKGSFRKGRENSYK